MGNKQSSEEQPEGEPDAPAAATETTAEPVPAEDPETTKVPHAQVAHILDQPQIGGPRYSETTHPPPMQPVDQGKGVID